MEKLFGPSPHCGVSLSVGSIENAYHNMRSRISIAKLILNQLESGKWEGMREASLRQVLAKLGAPHLEAAAQQVEWIGWSRRHPLGTMA